MATENGEKMIFGKMCQTLKYIFALYAEIQDGPII